MKNHYKILLFLCVFSFLYSLFFIKIYQYPILGDERTYYAYGVNLCKGNGYSYQEAPPFKESNLREPAYPFFISILFRIFGISKSAIQITQAVLNAIIVVITYILANLIFTNKKIALTAAFFTAISPTIAGYSALIASETLATVFFLLTLLAFLALLKEERSARAVGLSILTGLFCGCLVLTKMAYLLLLPLICFVLFIVSADKLIKYRALAGIAIVFIAVLLPWFSFNQRVYGNPFFLTNRGGITTAIKSLRLDWTPKEMGVAFIYPVSEGLVQRYFPREYQKVTYNPIAGSTFKLAFDRYDSLISQGYTEMAADRQLRMEALQKIKGNILKYLILSVSDLHFMLYFEGLPISQFTGFFQKATTMAINGFFKLYSLLIIFFAVRGTFIVLKEQENRSFKIVFLILTLYTFFIYSAIFGAPRFTFTIIPCLYILASVSISKMAKINTP